VHIGLDGRENLIYEGNWPHGRPLWPSPFISPARISYLSDGKLRAEDSTDSIYAQCRFREDHFDPVARIRRGRFYFGDGVNQQPAEWHVQPHPAIPSEMRSTVPVKKHLDTYVAKSIWHVFPRLLKDPLLVVLGLETRFSIWSIVNIEVISTGDDLVTLKARSGLGLLPRLDEEKISEQFRGRVVSSLEAFADEAYRAAPASVIDRARDAASQALLAFYNATGRDAKDLGDLVQRLEKDQKTIASSAGRIIARLHARAKPSEAERRALKPVSEQDAQLAIQCVGALLCELGWAEWV